MIRIRDDSIGQASVTSFEEPLQDEIQEQTGEAPTPDKIKKVFGEVKAKDWGIYKTIADANNQAMDLVEDTAQVIVGTASGLANLIATSTLGLVRAVTKSLRLKR